MRHATTSPVLALLLIAAFSAGPGPRARAGDPDPGLPVRDAKQQEPDLRIQLQAALLWANTNEARAISLLRFSEALLARLDVVQRAENPALPLLQQQNAALHKQIAGLQESLRAEQRRHVQDVTSLQRELAKAHATAEENRLQVVRAQDAARIAAHRLQERSQEVERLQWIQSRRAPRESVTRILTNIPASHWRSELRDGDAVRARVALQILAVLADSSSETIEAILAATLRHRSLYDAALASLVRIGAPAVQPLVAAGCGEDPEKTLNRGWVMHVLGSMGPAAKDALPWLQELAAGDGRKAGQAQRAIAKIRGK